MKTDKKSFAFTLAEALLTLTIIGVVMALMMKSINRVSPDKEKILFLKTYHAVEHAIVNTINDPSRYDPNYYSDNDIKQICPSGITSCDDLNIDFRFNPKKDAKVHINGKEITSCKAENPSTPCINQKNAICYFLADSLNTVGEVNCANNGGVNVRTSNGVCLRWLYDVNANGNRVIYIDPLCNEKGYAATIFNDGKMTVPQTSDSENIGTRQEKAYKWMLDQTQVK